MGVRIRISHVQHHFSCRSRLSYSRGPCWRLATNRPPPVVGDYQLVFPCRSKRKSISILNWRACYRSYPFIRPLLFLGRLVFPLWLYSVLLSRCRTWVFESRQQIRLRILECLANVEGVVISNLRLRVKILSRPTMMCFASYLSAWKLRSCGTECSPPLSIAASMTSISNSPHPSSSILKGGRLTTAWRTVVSLYDLGGSYINTLSSSLFERRMELISCLLEYRCRHFITIMIKQNDFNVPLAQRKPFNARGLIAIFTSSY